MSKYTVSRLKVLKVMGEALAYYDKTVAEVEAEMALEMAKEMDFDARQYDMLRERLEYRKQFRDGYKEAMNDFKFTR